MSKMATLTSVLMSRMILRMGPEPSGLIRDPTEPMEPCELSPTTSLVDPNPGDAGDTDPCLPDKPDPCRLTTDP